MSMMLMGLAAHLSACAWRTHSQLLLPLRLLLVLLAPLRELPRTLTCTLDVASRCLLLQCMVVVVTRLPLNVLLPLVALRWSPIVAGA